MPDHDWNMPHGVRNWPEVECPPNCPARATWSCTRDGVREPCGDCDGCRYDASVRRVG